MKYFRIIGILLFLWWMIDTYTTIKEEPYYVIFWFSNWVMLLLAISFFFKNKIMMSSVAIASLLTEPGWISDFIWRLITGNGLYPPAVTEYMFKAFGFTSLRFYIELNHIVVIPLALYGAYKLGIHKKAYLLCFAYSTVLNLSSFFFTPIENNINCVHYICLFSSSPQWLPQPYYLIIWILISLPIAFLLNSLLYKILTQKQHYIKNE